MQKIIIIAIIFIGIIVFMARTVVISSEGNYRPLPPDWPLRKEWNVVKDLRMIYKVQELFKSEKIKDQNHNGIGEYASTDELIRYIKEKKLEIETRFVISDKGLHDTSYHVYRVFIPPAVEEQEQYWLGVALRPPWREELTWVKSYFIDNKRDIIFYAENDSLKKLDLSAEDQNDPWSLKRIFWGEPFKSPIDTSIWKILDTSGLIGLRLKFIESQDKNKKLDKPK